MLIDYPNAKDYADEMFEKLHELTLLSADMLIKYKQHVVNLTELGFDYE
jgi:hypothetical protein